MTNFEEVNDKILFLFDVDGTLCQSRECVSDEMLEFLKNLKKKVKIGYVGGSDLSKQVEQIGSEIHNLFDYEFPENGVQFYENGNLISEKNMIAYIGEENNKKLINKILSILSDTNCPVKRGMFVENRRSMLNISPIGRSCSKEERQTFFEYDMAYKVRNSIVEKLTKVIEPMNVTCSIGGQISIDIFPIGWDKTYCLNHIAEETIVFFGDKTEKGGNDYEIFNHKRVLGNKTTGPENTIVLVNNMLERFGLSRIE